MNNFDISQEDAVSIFKEMIIPQMTSGVLSQEIKQAFILGGQPGSGKSAFARELIKINKNIVFINGDDLRAYHPKYYFYLKENDIEAADMTQAICNFWVESLIQECINRGLDFIVEGTMRKKEVPMITALNLKDNDYEINLVAISTPYELSLASLDYRYSELKRLGYPARFTKKESHDEAYRNIEETLSELLDSNLFKRFYIYQRCATNLKENIFNAEQKVEVLNCFKEGRVSAECNQELNNIR